MIENVSLNFAAVPVVLTWVLLVSIYAFLVYGLDKWRAMKGAWRISEAHLLFVAFIGGWPGAKAAQYRFRHKTRKEPFRTRLNRAVWGPVLFLIAAVALPGLGPRVEDAGRFLVELPGAIVADIRSASPTPEQTSRAEAPVVNRGRSGEVRIGPGRSKFISVH